MKLIPIYFLLLFVISVSCSTAKSVVVAEKHPSGEFWEYTCTQDTARRRQFRNFMQGDLPPCFSTIAYNRIIGSLEFNEAIPSLNYSDIANKALLPIVTEYHFGSTRIHATCSFTGNGQMAAVTFGSSILLKENDVLRMREAIMEQFKLPPIKNEYREQDCGITDQTYIGSITIATSKIP